MDKPRYIQKNLPLTRLRLQHQIKKKRKNVKRSGLKTLFVDVSVIIKKDAGTGIQRVVKSILESMYKMSLEGYEIIPVYCTKKESYKYAPVSFVKKFTQKNVLMPKGFVKAEKGDIFFALDLNAAYLKYHHKALYKWKLKGVKIHFLVYDLLPYYYPEWFSRKGVKNFKKWLKTIAVYADSLLCISSSVQNDLRKWLKSRGFSSHTPKLYTFPMGVNFKTLGNMQYGSDNSTHKLDFLEDEKFLLMVGTIEPRKGHMEMLDALEKLWRQGESISLVIVGKPGWKTNNLQERLRTLQSQHRYLHWLHDVSDDQLAWLYESSYGVVAASYVEGYGLPLLEAMYYGKPLLVRDVPVFNEVLGAYENVIWFKDDLEDKIVQFCKAGLQDAKEGISLKKQGTWEESVESLYQIFR